ncbi:MAG: glycerol kinase GlpK [Sphingomonadales bacterium]
MADDALILAIDQGTTSSRAILFSRDGAIIAVKGQEFPQIFPQPGWVEHDPEAIWSSTLAVCRAVLDAVPGALDRVAGIGITNQRETTLLWDARTGRAIHNAIVWQDRRTDRICQDLEEQGHEAAVQAKTGLLLDPYFSATKLAWLLDHVEGARELAAAGHLRFGTVDTFLLSRLTGLHATDATNASRTMLFNIAKGAWDDDLLALFDIPRGILPEVRDCVSDFGATAPELFGRPLPVRAIAGDQQAAAIGQACIEPGMVKSTYGTGCFALAHMGDQVPQSRHRLLGTIAWQLNGQRRYALEGSIFVAGAAVQWLRDGLGIIAESAETEALARSVADTGGVYFVPAFAGLGAPYWDAGARGAILGLSRGSGRAEIARACLEAMSYQTHDLLTAMSGDGAVIDRLRIDGGMARNDWLAQDLADMLDRPIDRPQVTETTAFGAALLAGLGAGLYASLDDVAGLWQAAHSFTPALTDQARRQRLEGWHQAVAQVRL